MRLATIRTADDTRAVRVDDDGAVGIGPADLGALLPRSELRTRVEGVGECRNVGRS